MESFWALVRRGYNGTFRHTEPKRPRRYVNGFAGRPGMKALGVVSKMCTMVRNLAGKRLTYGQLVAPNTPCGRP